MVEVHADFALGELRTQRVDIKRFRSWHHASIHLNLPQRLSNLFIHAKIKLPGLEVEALCALSLAKCCYWISDTLKSAGTFEITREAVSAYIFSRCRNFLGILDHLCECGRRLCNASLLEQIYVIDEAPELTDIGKAIYFAVNGIFLVDKYVLEPALHLW
ncbi:hypothetical protein D3C75_714660 [compost metagenome]